VKRRWLLLPLTVAAVAALALWPVTGRTLAARAEAISGKPPGDRAAAAAARVRPALERDLAAASLALGAPVFIRIFKAERELELWLDDGRRYRLFRTYPICTWSGTLGPKLRQGDGQSPEGFYRVGRGQLNPRSQYHLSFNLGYPNAYDRAHRRTGDFLMVHGSCVSIGCYAMGDAGIEEIYTLLDAALAEGQREAQVHAFPFRFDGRNEASWSGDPWAGFWRNLREGDEAFSRTGRPPRISVADRRYVVSETATPAR
jgi:murein L,D-transpeptidase YafK